MRRHPVRKVGLKVEQKIVKEELAERGGGSERRTLQDLPTPVLLLDLDRLERNCAGMQKRAARLGIALRPHLKTAKSAMVARLAMGSQAIGITVSTLAEVEYFAREGFDDITYAVGIVGSKIPQLAALQVRHGCRIRLLSDNVAAIEEVSARAQELGARFSLFIEIDCGGGRGGVTSSGMDLLALAGAIEASAALELAGVLTHAGQSYGAKSIEQLEQIAEVERTAVVEAAGRLRAAGHTVPFVSVGSTPTALFARSLSGVTDIRPGVYMFFDLDQRTLGTCSDSDLAASVLTSVIGHNPRSQRLLIDAGALALSKDLSARARDSAVGYGLVCSAAGGPPIAGLRVAEVHQEHGLIASDRPFEALAARYPVGTRLRILPNHVCMTAASYDRFHLVRGQDPVIRGTWEKARGW